jgi:hypothetical protein
MGNREGLTGGTAEMASAVPESSRNFTAPDWGNCACVYRKPSFAAAVEELGLQCGGLHTNFGTVDISLIDKQLISNSAATV